MKQITTLRSFLFLVACLHVFRVHGSAPQPEQQRQYHSFRVTSSDTHSDQVALLEAQNLELRNRVQSLDQTVHGLMGQTQRLHSHMRQQSQQLAWYTMQQPQHTTEQFQRMRAQLQRTTEQLQRAREQLSQEKMQHEQELAFARRDVPEGRHREACLTKRVADLEDQMKKSGGASVSVLRSELDALSKRFENMQGLTIEQLQQEIAELKKDPQGAEIADLRQKVQRLAGVDARLAAANAQIAMQTREITALRVRCAELQEALNKTRPAVLR